MKNIFFVLLALGLFQACSNDQALPTAEETAIEENPFFTSDEVWEFAGHLFYTGQDSAAIYRRGALLNVAAQTFVFKRGTSHVDLSLAFENGKPKLTLPTGDTLAHYFVEGNELILTTIHHEFHGSYDLVQKSGGFAGGALYTLRERTFFLEHDVNVLADPILLDGESPATFRVRTGEKHEHTYIQEEFYSAESFVEQHDAIGMVGYEWLNEGARKGNQTFFGEPLTAQESQDARFAIYPFQRWELSDNTEMTVWEQGRSGYIRIDGVRTSLSLTDMRKKEEGGIAYLYLTYSLENQIIPKQGKPFSQVEIKFRIEDKDQIFAGLKLK